MEAPKSNNVNWVAVEEGVEFALRGRPNREVLRQLIENEHCTHVITIQGERENCQLIQKWTESVDGATWVNIPLDNARPIEHHLLPAIHATFVDLAQAMRTRPRPLRLLFHCAAGLHRTGMISNAFLMFLGCSTDEAYTKIKAARDITALEVGVHRLYFGEQFVRVYGTRDSPNPEDLIKMQIELYRDEAAPVAPKNQKKQNNTNANHNNKNNANANNANNSKKKQQKKNHRQSKDYCGEGES